jgi:hypothetical protein
VELRQQGQGQQQQQQGRQQQQVQQEQQQQQQGLRQQQGWIEQQVQLLLFVYLKLIGALLPYHLFEPKELLRLFQHLKKDRILLNWLVVCLHLLP